MDTNAITQILNLIKKSQHILLLTHTKADCDGLSAMLATYLVLKKLNKKVTTISNEPISDNLHFLPAIDIVQESFSAIKDFIITLDCSQTPLSKIKYNLEDDRINIIISPKQGSFSEKDVSFGEGKVKYDLIMIFDTGNLEHLGMLYDQNTELFFEVPIINIDHHASNTDFGKINLVDVVASSSTEVLYNLLTSMEGEYNQKLISEDIATLLLAGIITDTGSFQNANTSPQAMETAAKLLDLGADQQNIIKNIYKTKKLSTLKLWGIILSKVQIDPKYRMVWSTISKENLQETGATEDESGGIIDELLTNAPDAEIVFLVKYNMEGFVSVSMRSTSNQIDVSKLCAEMGGGGHVRAAGFKVGNGRAFDQIVSEIITKVRQFQAKRLNIHENLISPHEERKGKSQPETDQLLTGEKEEKEIKPTKIPHSTKFPEKEEVYLDFQAPSKQKKQESIKEKEFKKITSEEKVEENHPEDKAAAPKKEQKREIQKVKSTTNNTKAVQPSVQQPKTNEKSITVAQTKKEHKHKAETKIETKARPTAPVINTPKPIAKKPEQQPQESKNTATSQKTSESSPIIPSADKTNETEDVIKANNVKQEVTKVQPQSQTPPPITPPNIVPPINTKKTPTPPTPPIPAVEPSQSPPQETSASEQVIPPESSKNTTESTDMPDWLKAE